MENATRAWDMAFYGLSFAPGRPDPDRTGRVRQQRHRLPPGRRAHRRRRRGRSTTTSPGQLSVSDLRRRLDDGSGPVKLVAITHVPTQGGLVNPAEEIGAATREAGVPYLLDACQSVGQLPVDVERDRLRPPLRDRTQVPPRTPRNRVPLRPPRLHRPARAAVPRPARSDLDRPRHATRSAPTRDASRTGRPTTRPRSASESPSTTPCPGAWTPSRHASPAWPTASGSG